MIARLKAFAKRHWPALRLRTILILVLFFVAAMPGLGAIFLRVYENTLVRQTEAELVAQSAALAAVARASWPGVPALDPGPRTEGFYRPETTKIDLSTTPVLPERPPAKNSVLPPDPHALTAAQVLRPIIDETSRTTLASIVLLDRQGRIVFGPESGSYGDLPEVRVALAGQPRTVLRRNGSYRPQYSLEWLSRAASLRIHHARPIRVGQEVVGAILVSRSPRALFRGIYEDRGKIALGVLVIFSVLVVLAGLVSRGVARPIEALSAAARQVAAGQGGIPETPATAAVEIRVLYEEFRTMAEAIARRSRYLRDFAAAVSHEFKTPLAGIGGAVELLEDHYETMSEAERRRFLANIAADTERLSQLVTRLLDLARADMARPEAGLAVHVAEPVQRSVDALRSGDLTIDARLAEDLPLVSVPGATIETVLTTLIENSRQAGARHIEVSARSDDQAVCLTVSDDGPGIPAAHRDRLFEPFFTTRRSDGGTGLGLAIARSLLEASNGAIAAVSADVGARFEVALPRAPSP